mmetsp:Transcript_43043/g.103786  ORF Transcript_43043/g.103786 Transcript_43043/m.103786 type:complete len:232 (+) Transcript_43043:2009-2704(+)
MRRVDLPDRRVPIDGELDGVKIALYMKSLAAESRFQAYTVHLGRQIERLAQQTPVLRKRYGVIVSVHQASDHIALAKRLPPLVVLPVPDLLAGAAKSKALVVGPQLELAKRRCKPDSSHTTDNHGLVHVFARGDLHGSTNAVPPLVVITFAFQAILRDEQEHVLVVHVELALEVGRTLRSHSTLTSKRLVHNLKHWQTKCTCLPTPCFSSTQHITSSKDQWDRLSLDGLWQ